MRDNMDLILDLRDDIAEREATIDIMVTELARLKGTSEKIIRVMYGIDTDE